MKSLSDKAGYLILSNLVKYAVGFAMPMVLVRLLSQDQYGTYQQLQLVYTIGLGVVMLGLPTSVFYFYGKVSAERRAALLRQTSAMLGGAAVVFAVALLLLAHPIAQRMSNPAVEHLLPIYLVYIVFMSASEHFVPFMISQNRYLTAVGFETSETFIRVFVFLVPIWLGAGVKGLVVATGVYALGRFLVRSIYLFRVSPHPDPKIREPFFVREQLSYSIPIALTSLVAVIGAQFDRTLIAAFFLPAQYAVYSVGALEIPLDFIFQSSVANVLRASLPPLVRENNLPEVVRIMREAVRKLSMIVLPSFIFLFAFSGEFITLLFTQRYEGSVPVFRIYLFLVPLHMLVLSPIPQVFGRTKVNLYIVGVATVFSVGLSYTLLKTIGFYGPALATASAAWVISGIYMVIVVRLTQSSVARLLPLWSMARVTLAALLSAALAKMIPGLTPVPLLNFVLAGVYFSLAYLAFAAAFSIFQPQDRALIRRWIAKFVPRLGRLGS